MDLKKQGILIFLESFFYIVMITLFVFLNTYGTIYFRILPLLFMLGILGKILFDRPVVTTIYTILISFLLIRINGEFTLTQNIISSLYAGFNVAIGEILGHILYEITIDYFGQNTEKRLEKSHAIICFISAFILLVIPVCLNMYINSDLMTYLKKKKMVEQYIDNKYGENNSFYIIDARYNYADKRFDFKTSEYFLNPIYYFTIFADNNIKDGHQEELIKNKNYLANILLSGYVAKYTDVNISIEYGYSSNVYLKIDKNVGSINDEKTIEFCKLVEQIIVDLKDYNYIEDVNKLDLKISSDTLGSRQTIIDIWEFRQGTDYIYNCLKIEYLDEN